MSLVYGEYLQEPTAANEKMKMTIKNKIKNVRKDIFTQVYDII